MSLAHARPLPRHPLPPRPEGPGPYPCPALSAWRDPRFLLPAGDPRLPALHAGGPAPSPPFENLVGAQRLWRRRPSWMDFLHPLSPTYEDKQIEQQLYLAHWDPLIGPPGRALDLGGGIGRWAQWLLSRGWEVELVDPDLRSLWRALHWAGEHPIGRFDLHWSTAEALPELAPVDLIVACEVLCYCEDPARVVANMLRVLRPGGRLLLSVEARWGWAMAPDAAPGSVDCLFGDGVVHVPGDRWVRTYQRSELETLLAPFSDVEIIPGHYAWSGPFEIAAGPRSPEAAIALEARLRQHPVAAPLNRTWMASARRPLDSALAIGFSDASSSNGPGPRA